MPHHVASSGSRTSGTREPLRTASADGLSSGSSGAVNGSAGCRGGGTGPSGGGGGNDIVDVVDDDCFGATDEVKVYKDEGDEDDDKPAENLSEEKFGLVIETEEDECKPTDIDRRRRLSGDENSNGGCSKSVKASDYFLPDHFPFSYPLIPPYPYPNGSPSAAKIFAHHPAMAAAAAAGFGFYMYQQHHHQQQQQHHGNITTITSEAAGGGGGGGELPSATTSASPSHSDPMSAYHGQPPPPPPAHMGIQPPSAAAAAAAAAAFYLDSKTGLPHHAMYALHSTSTQFPPHPLYASDLAHMPCFDLLSRTSASVPLAPHPSSPFDGAHQVNAPLPTPPTVPHHPTSTSPYSPSILGSIAPNACRPPPLSCWFTTTGPPSNVVPPPPPLLGGSAVYGRRTSPSPIGRRQQHSAIDDSSANSNDSMDDCLRYRPRPSFRHHDPIGIGGSRGSRGSHISPGGGGALCLQTTGHRKEYVKKPLNAFMLFMKECRQKVIEECTLKESAAINQILGRKWHALGRSEQAKYYEMARKEKELHMQLHPGWSARDNYATHTKKKKKQQHHHTIVTVPPHPPHRSSQHHHHNNQHHLHQPQQFHHNRTRDSSTSGLRRSSDSRQPPPCNSPMSTRVKDDPVDHRTAHSPPGIFSRSLLVNSDHSKPYRGSIRSAVRLHDDYTDDVKDASGMDSIDVGGCETGTGNRNISPTTVAALMIDEQRGTNIIAGLSGFRQHAAAATARSSVPHLSQSFRSPSSSPSPKSVSVGGGGGLFRSSATGPRHAIATMVDL